MVDSIEWVHDELLESLSVPERLSSVALHPPCAAVQLGLSDKLQALASELAEEVLVPLASGCCGMAGDRGLLHPELPAAALRGTVQELASSAPRACLCSNRTCEIALRTATGRPYESFVLALERLTRTGTGAAAGAAPSPVGEPAAGAV